MRRPAVIAVVAAVVVGCTVAPSPTVPVPSSPLTESPTGSSPTATASDAPPDPVPLPTLPPLDPSTAGLTCGDDLLFHPALLAAPGNAELDGDPAAAALRAEIALLAPDGELPRTGWVRVAQLPHRAEFVAPAGYESGWAAVVVERSDVRWQTVGVGQCRLQPAVADDVTVAEWRIDPAFPEPGPDATTLRVLITETACASGKPPNGRVLPPTIVTSADGVTVTFLVRRQPGGGDCQGNPEFPVMIELPEPLGERAVLNGGVFPPAVLMPAGGPIRAYQLSCGPMEIRACTFWADFIVESAERQHPGRKVVHVQVDAIDGDGTVTFDDGTTEETFVD